MINWLLTNLIALLFVTFAFSCEAKTNPQVINVPLENTILITSVIMPPTMKLRIQELNALQEQDVDVNIIINSPGGEVYSTLAFINTMEQIKASGHSIRCYVPGMAASAAFQILAHCTERRSLSFAFLLWHPVRRGVGGGLFGNPSLTPDEATSIANELNYLESILINDLRPFLAEVSDSEFSMHYHLETLHTGNSLHALAPNFVQPIQAISNLQEIKAAAKVQQKKDQEALLDAMFGFEPKFDYTTTVPCPVFFDVYSGDLW